MTQLGKRQVKEQQVTFVEAQTPTPMGKRKITAVAAGAWPRPAPAMIAPSAAAAPPPGLMRLLLLLHLLLTPLAAAAALPPLAVQQADRSTMP